MTLLYICLIILATQD